MQLRRYLDWCYDTLASRRDAQIEYLLVDEVYPGASGAVRGRLRFWDDSLLSDVLVEIERRLYP